MKEAFIIALVGTLCVGLIMWLMVYLMTINCIWGGILVILFLLFFYIFISIYLA
tara:strand:+ start:460 stop:621 length:162 start_codon:yes stop_codon:yes gene_type:complete